MTLDSSQTYISANEKQVRPETIVSPYSLMKINCYYDRDSSSTITSFSDYLIKTLNPKHGKLSRLEVLILQLTMITSYRPKTLIQNGPQTKERAIMNNEQNVELRACRFDTIVQTTALLCASVLTRERYSIIGVNAVSVSLLAAYYGCRMTNCDVIIIRNIITSAGTIPDTGN